jgi:CarD family transcriptional regulator
MSGHDGADALRLDVGDVVVYGSHGAGPVAARETRTIDGRRQTVIVLALAGGLSIELPLARARQQLRPLVDERAIESIGTVLRGEGAVNEESWLKRRRDAHAKLSDAVGLAEIIRDGTARETSGTSRRSASPLGAGERELVRRARELLTREIALARGVEQADVTVWIDEQLASRP